MATLVDINTVQVFYDVSIPDDTTGWLVNPDLTAVAGIDPMFWVINSDNTISPMTQSEQDAAYLSTAITNQCAAVDVLRLSILYGGFTYNGVPYDSDTQSIMNIAGTQTTINCGLTLPSNFFWMSAIGTETPFNNTTFTEFYAASTEWVEAIYAISWTHKANIAALTHYTDVMSYDFTTGWPTGFSSGAVTYS